MGKLNHMIFIHRVILIQFSQNICVQRLSWRGGLSLLYY